MSLDWSSTSIEHARDAQERRGWSDERLLDRMVTVLRTGHVPDIADRRARLVAEYDALPADTSVTARIEHLARVLPPLSGPWASVFLSDLLVWSETAPDAPSRDRPRGRSSRESADRDPWTSWRRGVPIMLLTLLAMAAYAGGRVWLG